MTTVGWPGLDQWEAPDVDLNAAGASAGVSSPGHPPWRDLEQSVVRQRAAEFRFASGVERGHRQAEFAGVAA